MKLQPFQFRRALLILPMLTLFGCSKKNDTPAPPAKTVLTGYYSLVGLYSINSDGTYTAKQVPSCFQGFSLDLMSNNLMQFQDACQNITGSWSYSDNIFTMTDASGTVDIKGAVQFEADGITIEVNSTVDNTRYVLWRD